MLLNRTNLNIAKLASKDASRFSLQVIRVTPQETIATDGHTLMRIANASLDAEAFPVTEGLTAVNDFKPFNLPAESALKAMAALPKKTTIPVLTCAAVAVNGDPLKPKVVTNDLEQVARFESVDGNFPDIERVMPDLEKTTFAICLDARKLKPLLDQFIAAQDLEFKKNPACVVLSFTDSESAVTITRKGGEQAMTALIMPMRLDSETKGYKARKSRE